MLLSVKEFPGHLAFGGVFLNPQNPTPVPRTMRVLLAPHLPPRSLSYYIDSSGVHGMDEEDHAR